MGQCVGYILTLLSTAPCSQSQSFSLTGLLAPWLVTSQSHLGICSSCRLFFHCRGRYITLQSLCFIHSSSNIWPLEGQELCVLLICVSLSSASVYRLREWHCPDLQAVCSHQGRVDESVLSARFLWAFVYSKKRALAVPEGLAKPCVVEGNPEEAHVVVGISGPGNLEGKAQGLQTHLPKLRVFLRKRQRKMKLGRKPRSGHGVLMPQRVLFPFVLQKPVSHWNLLCKRVRFVFKKDYFDHNLNNQLKRWYWRKKTS